MPNYAKLALIIYSTGWLSSDPKFVGLRTGFEGGRSFYSLIHGTEGPNRFMVSKIRLVKSVYMLFFFVISYDISCALHLVLFIT